ncbi:unnamed protein product (mitochondrion) [Plasmodiophora brassicae]|uniref:Uncharacterized protein n=1 Tax=Plasmodiophora brassicae TaxID=37360 RepID=A0A3P3YJ66_PLABS|nr:unnamed protein product [Plasmodiophora brassicae]
MLATFAIVISWSDAVTVRDVVESEMKKARAQIHIGLTERTKCPASNLWGMAFREPWVSGIYSAGTEPKTARLWQARTLRVDQRDGSPPKFIALPFLLNTGGDNWIGSTILVHWCTSIQHWDRNVASPLSRPVTTTWIPLVISETTLREAIVRPFH